MGLPMVVANQARAAVTATQISTPIHGPAPEARGPSATKTNSTVNPSIGMTENQTMIAQTWRGRVPTTSGPRSGNCSIPAGNGMPAGTGAVVAHTIHQFRIFARWSMRDIALRQRPVFHCSRTSGVPTARECSRLGAPTSARYGWAVRSPSSSGLGHRPFKAAARVRIPLGMRSRSRQRADFRASDGLRYSFGAGRERLARPSKAP